MSDHDDVGILDPHLHTAPYIGLLSACIGIFLGSAILAMIIILIRDVSRKRKRKNNHSRRSSSSRDRLASSGKNNNSHKDAPFTEIVTVNNTTLAPYGRSILDTTNNELDCILPDGIRVGSHKSLQLLSRAGNEARIQTSQGTIMMNNNDSVTEWIWTCNGVWAQINSLNHDSMYSTKQQGPKLAPLNATGTGLGTSLSLSANGDYLAAGGYNSPSATGATWIFVRQSVYDAMVGCNSNRATAQWVQQGPALVGSGSKINDEQGASVALNADATTLAVGAPNDSSSVGTVYIFVRSGTTWTQQAKLLPTGAVGAPNFGAGVALSADGNTLVVGGPSDHVAGAIWIFTRVGVTWTLLGTKHASAHSIGASGTGASVAISSDGAIIVAGAPNDNGSQGAGFMWIRLQTGLDYVETNPLVSPGIGSIGPPNFGTSVAISASGRTVVIGGPGDNGSVGATWVYEQVESGTATILTSPNIPAIYATSHWISQTAKLVGYGYVNFIAKEPNQGTSVAISSDGNTIVTGGPLDFVDSSGAFGATWQFHRTGNNAWTLRNQFTGANNFDASFGSSVALDATGSTLAVGGNTDNNNTGAAWVFT